MNQSFLNYVRVLLLMLVSSIVLAQNNAPMIGQASVPPGLVTPHFDPKHRSPMPMAFEDLMQRSFEGVAWVKCLVSESGSILDVQIVSSSGSKEIDQKVVGDARRWKLLPGSFRGTPISMWMYSWFVVQLGAERGQAFRWSPAKLAAAKKVKLEQEEYLLELQRTLVAKDSAPESKVVN